MPWNPDPVMLRVGDLAIFWYGFLFTAGLFATVWMGHRFFVERGLEEKHASNLTFALLAGLFIGAHVIDVVFYNWPVFVENPLVLFDFRFGLSSHGGAVGVISALYLYARVMRLDFHRVADAITLAAVWLFPFIRTGNFINSEVVGRPTTVPWGVVFEAVDPWQARHPSQLYEAALGTSLIILGMVLHKRWRHRLRKGATSYLLLGIYFTVRFLLEFFKDRQAITEDAFFLNMGQLLSLPGAVIFGWLVWKRRPLLVEPGDPEAGDPRPPGSKALIGQGEPSHGSAADTDP
ncbi:prolipoprotein diacylglyceryl transferase [Paraliomyxa miuraensis]|uniref:prolipoprotein diacylglyceryl transferase n=1 Tax=Paraliomyxa miuraensis TaxID=376150 RepID=UPI00225B9937|nr:prolipoprotein diacylglyceryl transferase [Paraliomyxa miuraensis]MCX4239703.1 prolipoprotein diacylglyceryl transferase [Paraliomyxa miuraensis]